MVQITEYRTAEQETAERWSDHFDIRNFLFDILRFKEPVVQMRSTLIAFLLNSGF